MGMLFTDQIIGDKWNCYDTQGLSPCDTGIKGFRAELHGISNLPFFFYRVCKIYG